MFVSVCISLYMSICLYLFICLYLCTSFRSSSQGSNSQQQYANSLAVTAVTAACLYLSISSISLHICLYQTYIRTYMHIFVHICKYSSYLDRESGPGPIARTNLTGNNLWDQADNHSCAYVLICDNLCVYQTYVCTYVLISGHICLYPKT